jgi:hypothetical protein
MAPADASQQDQAPFLSHAFRGSFWPLWDRRTTWAILGLLSLVGGLYLWQAGEVTSAQHRIRELAIERQHWEVHNVELQKEIASLTRVASLMERAKALGFVAPRERMFIEVDEQGNPTSVRVVP